MYIQWCISVEGISAYDALTTSKLDHIIKHCYRKHIRIVMCTEFQPTIKKIVLFPKTKFQELKVLI